MSETRDEGSIDARLNAVLREMVAGQGSAELRARVMTSIEGGRDRARGSRAFPWPRLALVAALLVAAAVMVGRVSRREPAPEALPVAARAIPNPALPPDARAQRAALESGATVVRSPTGAHRATSLVPPADSAPEDSFPRLQMPPIDEPSPLALPPVTSTSIDASSLGFPPLAIEPLPAEPPLSGSF